MRIDSSGYLATTDHPSCLGSALTNGQITTDYSEALMELVTPVHQSPGSVHARLTDLHAFVHRCLGDEMLWTTSMPCIVPRDELIPVARYGKSNVGMMKTVYRLGLGHRYGRVMQTIAGVHYNISMPASFWALNEKNDFLGPIAGAANASDPVSHHYFAMVRNVHRYCWILLYLLGASPAVCKSFVSNRDHGLEEFDSGSVYAPYATSLRMSRLGYQNNAQDDLDIRYNDLREYTDSLIRATQTPHPAYVEIGTKHGDEWRQLNTNILQIENEYYAVVRPKRVANSGEKPSHALRERGVEYVELRAIDLDPFEAAGISLDAIHFLDTFATFCMLEKSAPVTDKEQACFSENQSRVVMKGRAPDVQVFHNNAEMPLREAAMSLITRMTDVAQLLDQANATDAHTSALATMRARVEDPELTPSARVLREMRDNGERFADFGLRWSKTHHDNLLERGLAQDIDDQLSTAAVESLSQQAEIERNDSQSFDDYLAEYMR